MKNALSWLLYLYVLALMTGIAGMEFCAWFLVIGAALVQWQRPDFSIFKDNKATNYWLAALVLAVLMSLLVNPAYRPFLLQFGFMRWVIVLWGLTFALDRVWDDLFVRRLVPYWVGILVITGIYAGVQCFTGYDLLRVDAVEAQGGGIFRAVGWFSAPLTFAYSFGVALFAVSRPAYLRLKPIWFWLLCFSGLLALVASVSRGAWLAGVVTTLLYLACTWRVMVLPAAAFFFALSKALIWYSPGFAGKIEQMEAMHVDHSSSVRLDLWQGYWAMFKDHPLFGVGLGQGDKFLPEYFTKLGIDQEFTSHAHNNFLQFLGGTGLFGCVAYCAVIFIFLRKAWRLRGVTAWGWSLFLAQIYMQLGGLTEANFIDGEVNHILVFTWALVLVLEARHKRGEWTS